MDQWEAAINTWREGIGRVKLFHGRVIRVLTKSPARIAVPRHFGWDGIAVGHLLGVRSSERVGDLDTAQRPSWLSISTLSVEADSLWTTNESPSLRIRGSQFSSKIGVQSDPI